jgi:universal stress protein A
MKIENQSSKDAGPARQDSANGPPPLAWKNILAPTDLSEPSKSAIKTAVALARMCGAKLTLLHVVQMPVCCSFDAPPDMNEITDQARESLNDLARTFPPDVSVEKIVRLGSCEPAAEIVEKANDISADLIVIATHGYSGLKRVLLGSTAERVVRHAQCPVLIVRRPHAAVPGVRLQKETENAFRKNRLAVGD